jgi:periplasmic protein CpxP/Spy
MKKFGLLVLSVMLAALICQAQPGQRSFDPEVMAKRQTEQIKEAVGLNADQEKQVYDLNIESGKKMRAMREENQGAGFEGMREKMGKIREEQDKKMKEILTEAQWEKYLKYQEERRSRRGQGRPGGGN